MTQLFYIGAYNRAPYAPENHENGLFVYALDDPAGPFRPVQALEGGDNPSFIGLHPNRRVLYVTNELKQGYASAYAIDPASGRLTRLNSADVQGADPCYLSVTPSGRWLLVACYTSGSLAVLPIREDGSLGALAQRIQHKGSGPVRPNQEQARAHFIHYDPSGQFVLVADLGMDRVLVYRLDEQTGHLSPSNPPSTDFTPGSGPRHLAFHPDGRHIYISNELNWTVTACEWDVQSRTLKPVQTLSTLSPLSDAVTGEKATADIHLTPAGDFLYVSNRGENTLAAFRVDARTRLLERIGTFPCRDWPRNFAIAPGGESLLVANQRGDSVAAFHIAADGALACAGELAIPAPVCVRFAE